MSRGNTGSYSHKCKYIGGGDYEISWVVDHHYADSRLRFPRSHRRYTDKRGAERFCKKWRVQMPDGTSS